MSSFRVLVLILSIVVVVCFACQVGLFAAEPEPETEWPRFGGPRGDSSWVAPPLPEEWPATGLKQAWRRDIGGGYGGVTVSNGRVYVMDRQTSPAEVERVLCLDASSGESLWTHEYRVEYGKLDYGNGPRASCTIHQGRVVTFGAMGHAHCLDAASGKVFWSHDFVKQDAAKIPEWGLSASPAIVDDFVVFHPGAARGGCYVALRIADGSEVWRSGDDPAGYSAPLLADTPSGRQLIAWTPENVTGLDPLTGKKNWSFPYKVTYGVSIAAPICRDGYAVVCGFWEGSKGIKLGDKPESATLAWEETRLIRGLMSQPLYRDGKAYVLGKHHGLSCFEVATGKVFWGDNYEIAERSNNPQATIVWLDDADRVMALNDAGELVLARMSPGGLRVTSRTPMIKPTDKNLIWAAPAFSGRRVFARSDAEIVAIELPAKRSSLP